MVKISLYLSFLLVLLCGNALVEASEDVGSRMLASFSNPPHPTYVVAYSDPLGATKLRSISDSKALLFSTDVEELYNIQSVVGSISVSDGSFSSVYNAEMSDGTTGDKTLFAVAVSQSKSNGGKYGVVFQSPDLGYSTIGLLTSGSDWSTLLSYKTTSVGKGRCDTIELNGDSLVAFCGNQILSMESITSPSSVNQFEIPLTDVVVSDAVATAANTYQVVGYYGAGKGASATNSFIAQLTVPSGGEVPTFVSFWDFDASKYFFQYVSKTADGTFAYMGLGNSAPKSWFVRKSSTKTTAMQLEGSYFMTPGQSQFLLTRTSSGKPNVSLWTADGTAPSVNKSMTSKSLYSFSSGSSLVLSDGSFLTFELGNNSSLDPMFASQIVKLNSSGELEDVPANAAYNFENGDLEYNTGSFTFPQSQPPAAKFTKSSGLQKGTNITLSMKSTTITSTEINFPLPIVQEPKPNVKLTSTDINIPVKLDTSAFPATVETKISLTAPNMIGSPATYSNGVITGTFAGSPASLLCYMTVSTVPASIVFNYNLSIEFPGTPTTSFNFVPWGTDVTLGNLVVDNFNNVLFSATQSQSTIVKALYPNMVSFWQPEISFPENSKVLAVPESVPSQFLVYGEDLIKYAFTNDQDKSTQLNYGSCQKAAFADNGESVYCLNRGTLSNIPVSSSSNTQISIDLLPNTAGSYSIGDVSTDSEGNVLVAWHSSDASQLWIAILPSNLSSITQSFLVNPSSSGVYWTEVSISETSTKGEYVVYGVGKDNFQYFTFKTQAPTEVNSLVLKNPGSVVLNKTKDTLYAYSTAEVVIAPLTSGSSPSAVTMTSKIMNVSISAAETFSTGDILLMVHSVLGISTSGSNIATTFVTVGSNGLVTQKNTDPYIELTSSSSPVVTKVDVKAQGAAKSVQLSNLKKQDPAPSPTTVTSTSIQVETFDNPDDLLSKNYPRSLGQVRVFNVNTNESSFVIQPDMFGLESLQNCSLTISDKPSWIYFDTTDTVVFGNIPAEYTTGEPYVFTITADCFNIAQASATGKMIHSQQSDSAEVLSFATFLTAAAFLNFMIIF